MPVAGPDRGVRQRHSRRTTDNSSKARRRSGVRRHSHTSASGGGASQIFPPRPGGWPRPAPLLLSRHEEAWERQTPRTLTPRIWDTAANDDEESRNTPRREKKCNGQKKTPG